MSIRAMTRVWEDSPRSGNELIVLLALADWANDDGYCWPSIPTLATKARLHERTVQRLVVKLQSEGDIQIHEGGFISGKNRTNTYRVLDPPRQTATPSEPSVGNRQEEPPSLAATSAADGEQQLFEAPRQSSAKFEAAALDIATQVVWDYYVQLFADRLRVKELTAPRKRTIQKALKAAGYGESDEGIAIELCKRAISGLKSYRASHPDGSQDVNISVIFETGPHSKSNLTDQIQWWADQSESTVPVPGAAVRVPIDLVGVPSVSKGTIQARRREVGRMYDHPESPEARERGEAAVDWLKEHVGHAPKVVDGELRGWELV